MHLFSDHWKKQQRRVRAPGQLLAQGRGFPSSLSVLKWNRKFWEGVSLPYGETKQGLQTGQE